MYPGEYGRTTPNKPAVIMGSSGTVVTYAELDERSRRLSRLLHERGLVRGDMVAIFAENNPRYFEVAWAALRSGMYLVTVNRYLQAEEAAYLITDSTAKAFISTKNQSKVAQEMLAFIPDCPVRLMMDGTVDGFDSYEDALASTTDEAFASQPAVTSCSIPRAPPVGRRELSAHFLIEWLTMVRAGQFPCSLSSCWG